MILRAYRHPGPDPGGLSADPGQPAAHPPRLWPAPAGRVSEPAGLDPGRFGAINLEAWRERLLLDGRSPATHAQAMSALRSFLDWVAAQLGHDMPWAVLRALKIPKRKVLRPYEELSKAELAALLAAAADHLRDRALLAVLLGAGLRASEAVTLDVQDFRLDGTGGWYLHIPQGKGGRDRRVPLRASVAAAVRAYLDATGRPLRAEGAVFLGGGPGRRLPRRPQDVPPGPGLPGPALPGPSRDRGQACFAPRQPAHLRPAGPARPRPSGHHPGLPGPPGQPGNGGPPGGAAGPGSGGRCQGAVMSPSGHGMGGSPSNRHDVVAL